MYLTSAHWHTAITAELSYNAKANEQSVAHNSARLSWFTRTAHNPPQNKAVLCYAVQK